MQPHRPRKRFGQHFLRDAQVIERLVRAIAPQPDQRLLEIGPGEGVLTRPLLAAGARVTAVELDRDLAASLAERLGRPPGLDIVQADILQVDIGALAGDRPLRVVGNLPYNISTPILFHLFAFLPQITDLHFMLQKEVVDRLVAEPGSRDYGRLSVMAGFFCDREWLFDVPPGAFRPPPKVTSAVIRLRPRPLGESAQRLHPALEAVVRQAFGQRRKTLRNNLKGRITAGELEALGIDPGRRPQTLGVEEFVRIANHLAASGGEGVPE